MRHEMMAISLVGVLCGAGVASGQTAPSSKSAARSRYAERTAVDMSRKTTAPGLAGIWTAPVYEIPLGGDLDRQVWGPKVSLRRNVVLAIESSGEGVLTVDTAVVDARGRVRPGSQSIEEARLHVEMPTELGDARLEPTVKVLNAERRYTDDPTYHWPLDRVALKLSTVASDANRINIFFEAPDGRASFGESLFRQRPVQESR